MLRISLIIGTTDITIDAFTTVVLLLLLLVKVCLVGLLPAPAPAL